MWASLKEVELANLAGGWGSAGGETGGAMPVSRYGQGQLV
jgi:hypothetical protein